MTGIEPVFTNLYNISTTAAVDQTYLYKYYFTRTRVYRYGNNNKKKSLPVSSDLCIAHHMIYANYIAITANTCCPVTLYVRFTLLCTQYFNTHYYGLCPASVTRMKYCILGGGSQRWVCLRRVCRTAGKNEIISDTFVRGWKKSGCEKRYGYAVDH